MKSSEYVAGILVIHHDCQGFFFSWQVDVATGFPLAQHYGKALAWCS